MVVHVNRIPSFVPVAFPRRETAWREIASQTPRPSGPKPCGIMKIPPGFKGLVSPSSRSGGQVGRWGGRVCVREVIEDRSGGPLACSQASSPRGPQIHTPAKDCRCILLPCALPALALRLITCPDGFWPENYKYFTFHLPSAQHTHMEKV